MPFPWQELKEQCQAVLDNVHNFPRPAVTDALEQAGITTLQTDLHGAISLTLKSDKIEVRRGRQ